MIVKEHSVPIRMVKLEVLFRRLSDTHFRRLEIEQDYSKRKAGYNGELSLDYYLHSLPKKDYMIFHGLRLPTKEQNHFQIDALLLTSHFALILEVKNIMGTLFFDQTFNQLIRTTDNVEQGFSDPIAQAKRQNKYLKMWLEDHGVETLPTEYLIVISKPSTIIKADSYHVKNFVVHNHSLLEKISKIEERYKFEVLDNKGLRKLSKLLTKDHSPENFDALQYYGIPQIDIKTGVQCPHCSFIPMKRISGNWYCSACRTKSKNAHVQALIDYFLLIDGSISNREFRRFMHLSSKDTANRLLRSLNLPSKGTGKGKIYHKPLDLCKSTNLTPRK